MSTVRVPTHQDARRAQYEADTLCLARDLAQVGSIYKEVEKTEHAKRTEKLVHLRAQNTIGAAIVSEFMGQNMAVMSGVIKEQLAAIDRECAQLLSGDQLPTAVISGLLTKSKIEGSASVLALVNLTPYDAFVERFAKNGFGVDKPVSFKCLSLTKHLNAAQYVERTLAIDLLEE
eukprot:s221_g13.t1